MAAKKIRTNKSKIIQEGIKEFVVIDIQAQK
jgi:hypothetical protein